MGSSSSEQSPAVSAEHKPASHIVALPPVNTLPESLTSEPLNTAMTNPMFGDTSPVSSQPWDAAKAERPASVAQSTSEIEPEAELARAQEPATPAQERRRRLDSAPAAASGLAEMNAFTKPRRKRNSQRMGSLDPDAQRKARQAVKRDTTGAGSSVPVQGQDTLEVRTVTLANGQKASLILEDGRLQRIVAANGQVAELRWQAPSQNRVPVPGTSQPALAVKLRGPTAMPPWGEERTTSQAMPPMIRRWANSLSSQRLTTGPDAPYPKRNSLMTAPTGYGGTDSSRDSRGERSIHSLEIMTSESGAGKKKGFLQSLFSAPLPNAKAPATAADMPTIMETNREVNRDWNPIHESWLPTEMTTQFLGGTPLNSQGPPSAQRSDKQDLRSARRSTGEHGHQLWTGESDGIVRSATHSRQDPVHAVKTQSADLGSMVRPRVAWAPQETPTKRGANQQENFRLNAALYDSDPGPQMPVRKLSFWARLKRVLHLPSISRSRDYGGSSTASSKRRSIFSRRPKTTKSSFAFSDETSAAEALHEEMQLDKRNHSMSALPDSRATAMAREVAKPKSSSAHLLSSGKSLPSETRQQPGGSVPVTPQQREGPGVVNATPTTPPDAIEVTQSIRTGDTKDGPVRSLQRSLELADGTGANPQVQEALAMHDQSSHPLLSQVSTMGEEGRNPRGRRTRRITDPNNLIKGKARTMMAGKWQKNFTEGTSGIKVDELLQVSSLHRLARERIVEMEVVETEETFEMVWHIPLNGSASKISKTDRYLKNGEVVEAARRDGRPGVLRSQLTFTPEGHVHIRALQGEPFQAVFHDRIKLSTGGRRIKIEQKFQLLQPGVLPVKHYSIWNRVE